MVFDDIVDPSQVAFGELNCAADALDGFGEESSELFAGDCVFEEFLELFEVFVFGVTGIWGAGAVAESLYGTVSAVFAAPRTSKHIGIHCLVNNVERNQIQQPVIYFLTNILFFLGRCVISPTLYNMQI